MGLRNRVEASITRAAYESDSDIYFGDIGLVNPFATEQLVLQIPGAWRALETKAETISRFPFHVFYEEDDGTVIKVSDQPQIVAQPDMGETRDATINKLVCSLVLHGEAFALLGGWRDTELGQFATVLKVVHPNTVGINVYADGGKTYTIANEEHDPSTVLRIQSGILLPGCERALSRVLTLATTWDHVNAQAAYGRKFFKESATPTGLLKVNRKSDEIDPKQLEELKTKIMQTLSGGSRKPLALPNDISWENVSSNPEQSQLVQARELSLTDIANAMNIPASFIGAPGSSRTYANQQQDDLSFLKFSLNETKAIERGFSSLLPRGYYVRFNYDSLLRTDTKTRIDTLRTAVDAGIYTVNEARALEELPPLPEDDAQSGDSNE